MSLAESSSRKPPTLPIGSDGCGLLRRADDLEAADFDAFVCWLDKVGLTYFASIHKLAAVHEEWCVLEGKAPLSWKQLSLRVTRHPRTESVRLPGRKRQTVYRVNPPPPRQLFGGRT